MARRRRALGAGIGLGVVLLILLSLKGSDALDPPPLAARGDEASEARAPRSPPERGAGPTPEPEQHGALREAGVSGATDASRPSERAAESETAAREAMKRWLDENAREADALVDTFCERSASALHVPRGSGRDAALFLAARVDWGDDLPGMLHLAAPLVTSMSASDDAWLQLTPTDYAGLDFSWLTELAQFDTWTLGAAGPLQAREVEDATPDPAFIRHWAALRLIKGRDDGQLDDAIREVRHLGMLSASTGMGTALQSDLFELERRVRTTGGAVSLPEPPLEAATRARDLGQLSPFFLLPGVSGATVEKALACSPSRCESLALGLLYNSFARDVASTAERRAALKAAARGCDTVLLDHVERVPPRTAAELVEMFGAHSVRRALTE